MALLTSLIVNDTGNLTLPVGSNSNRPSTTPTVVQWTNTGTQAVSVLTGSATTTSTSWTCPNGVTSIEVLVVAGGGAGGWHYGGGGGAGGVVYNSAFPVTPSTTYSVTVGQGGAGSSSARNNGGNSVFSTLTAVGGGGGGSQTIGTAGLAGGSGGGGSYSSGGGIAGTATAGQGNPGGQSNYPDNVNYGNAGSGGGGAGGRGFPAPADGTDSGGNGGSGVVYSITGSAVGYAGGGGGGTGGYNIGSRQPGMGTHGAGSGGTYNAGAGTAGVAGTGGGGGGGAGGSTPSHTGSTQGGGSGTVVIRYNVSSDATYTDPRGQIRYNTVTNTIEAFKNNNWQPTGLATDIVTTGLVALYDAARYGSGTTWVDLTNNGNDLTLVNAPTYNSSNGGYFTFNGSSQRASKTSFTGLDANPTYTFAAWVKIGNGANGSGTDLPIVWYGGTGATAAIATIDQKGMNFASMHYADDLTFSNLTLTTSPWYYVAITYNSFTKLTSLYVDGQFIQSASHTNALNIGTATFNIGGGTSGSGYFWSGSVAVTQVYSRLLTLPEIQQNFNAQVPRFRANNQVYSQIIDSADVVKRPVIAALTNCILHLDAGDASSNPSINGSAPTTKWYDMARGMHGDFSGIPGKSIDNGGYFSFGQSQHCKYDYFQNVMNNKNQTLEAWVYPTQNSTDSYVISIGTAGTGGGRGIRAVSGYWSAVGFGSSDQDFNDFGASCDNNAWQHVVACWSGDSNCRIRFYKNGVEFAGTKNLGNINGNVWAVGCTSWASDAKWGGRIAVARIYNKALTAEEVIQNFNAQRGRFGI
jgi:hypothetical protein